jgi:hypothetical protein
MAASRMSDFPQDRFSCVLDEQPHYLVPERLLPSVPATEPLVINPACWFCWYGPPPPHLAARISSTDDFHESPWMIWVDDPGTRALWPFWLGPEYAHLLHQLVPGMPVPDDFPEAARTVFTQAGVFVPVDHFAQRREGWRAAAIEYQRWFARGYVSVLDLLHPFHVGALRRYYRYRTRTGAFMLGDTQTPDRYVAHNESVSRFFHFQLRHMVSDVAGGLVRPSYCYLAAYQNGADLPRHVDREQCEYSITLCLDATPEPMGQSPWPIELQTSEGELRIWQSIGDGLVYRGRYLPHWRERLPDDCTATALLWHYVDDGYTGKLD